MKASGKIIGRLIVGCVFACCLSRFPSQTFAIEGLKVSIQNTNVMLSWPSDPSETYIVQYRHTLDPGDAWVTLADLYPADYTTNVTSFVDTSMNFGSGYAGDGGGSGSISFDSLNMLFNSGSTLTMEDIIRLLTPPMPGDNRGGGLQGITRNNPTTDNSAPLDSPNSTSNTAMPGTGFYRVVRDGAHLYGLTNGTVLSGIVRIRVELANGSGTVSTMSLTENESPVGNSIQTAPLVSPGALIVDTTQMSNGVHQISASARWDDTNGGLWEADSPPISVTVSNEISFENWMPSFGETGNTFLFRATSAHPNTDWVVSVYGDNTYLGYFYGHTDNGNISFYYDYSGTSLTNISVFSFEIATEYIDPPTPPIIKVNDPWSGPGAWAIAVQHDWDSTYSHDLLYQEFNSGFVAYAASWFTVLPSPDGDGNPLALHVGDPSDPQPDADWASFRQAITNSQTRNLVYFGHGGPNGIGKNPANTKRYISASEIANALHTNPPGQTNRHAFRFVFLDGCSTAKGALPEAFGIIHKVNVPIEDYAAASLRPSAFVGWTADKWITFLFGYYLNEDHVKFIGWIQYAMLANNYGIQAAIDFASRQPDVRWAFVWLNQMSVYGYGGLTLGAYNN